MPQPPLNLPQLIDFLIEKEKKERENAFQQPFLHVPTQIMPQNDEKVEKIEKKETVIIIDL